MVTTSAILLMAVWNNNVENIHNTLNSRLDLAHATMMRQIDKQKDKLMLNVHNLSNNPKFINALTNGNETEISEAMESAKSFLKANMLTLLDENDKIQSSTDSLIFSIPQEQLSKMALLARETGVTAEIRQIGSQLYYTLYVPTKSLDDAKLIIITYVVNKRFVEGIKALINAEVSFITGLESNYVLSTLPADKVSHMSLKNSLIDDDSGFAWKLAPLWSKQHYFSKNYDISEFQNPIINTIYLSLNAETVTQDFLKLQLTISLIALSAVGVALIAGRLLSKDITKPIEVVAEHASQISKGEYSQPISMDTCSIELEKMIHAFNAMQNSVQEREREIVQTAQTDPLTGLHTRTYVKELLKEKYLGIRYFQAIGINIFGFRGINDVFGYHCGDLCLQELANRVKKLGGETARLTGGEILWLPDTVKTQDELIAIKRTFDVPVNYKEFKVPLKTAVGIVDCQTSTTNPEDLFKRLNIIIDEAQISRKLFLSFDDSIERKYLRRLSIISNLKKALFEDSEELALVYQPKLDLINNSIHQAEALIRWNNPALGFVAPDEFIGIAEQAGFVSVVTKWVLKRAVRDVLAFKAHGIDINVAVNISPEDVMDNEFVPYIQQLLDESQLDCEAISFELTESVIVKEPQKAIERIQILRDAGFKIAVDDFGTGYSSLSYLTQLPIDLLKIDRCFVRNLAKETGDQAICQTVIELASKFELEVVAEGIEDVESLTLLKSWGCHWGQGYYINRPVPAKEFVRWVKEYQANNLSQDANV